MRSREGVVTPVGAVVRGLAAAAAGTLAMDLVLFARYRRGGGETGFRDWELSAEVGTWDQAPAPAQVGKRLVEGLFQNELPDRRASLVNNITHRGCGVLGGAPFGLVAGSLPRPRVWYGLPFGATVWGSGYVVLPAANLYRPIWEYDGPTLAKDLGAHLVYGLTTGAVFASLSRWAGRRSTSRPTSGQRRPGGWTRVLHGRDAPDGTSTLDLPASSSPDE